MNLTLNTVLKDESLFNIHKFIEYTTKEDGQTIIRHPNFALHDLRSTLPNVGLHANAHLLNEYGFVGKMLYVDGIFTIVNDFFREDNSSKDLGVLLERYSEELNKIDNKNKEIHDNVTYIDRREGGEYSIDHDTLRQFIFSNVPECVNNDAALVIVEHWDDIDNIIVYKATNDNEYYHYTYSKYTVTIDW